MKNIFIILLYSTILFGVCIQDWKLLLVVPFALIVSWFNFKAKQRNLLTKLWHRVQYAILMIAFTILVFTKVIKWDEIIILLSLYYVAFETSLNALLKQPLNYIGKTSDIDKWIRKITKTEAMLNQVSSLSKFILLFIGIAIYLTGK